MTRPDVHRELDPRRLTRRTLGAWLLAATVAACGGGGGGSDGGPVLEAPPATAATLAQDGPEAVSAVRALGGTAQALLEKSRALDGGSLFSPLGTAGASVSSHNVLARAAREQALERQTLSCANLGLTGCSGSVTVDTNVDGNAAVLSAGTYITLEFNALSFIEAGSPVSINGSFRMDFLTSIDAQAASLANARLQIEFGNLSGTVDGVSFGPATEVALLEFDAAGAPAVTIDGLRITGLDGLNVIDADDFTINGTTLRRAHWSHAAAYVDVTFSNWTVSAGRPTAGSTATITGANGGSAVITVDSVTATQVVYLVHVTIGGASVDYVVTADTSASPPTYTVTGAI